MPHVARKARSTAGLFRVTMHRMATKTYITHLSLTTDADAIEDVQENAQAVIKYAEEKGFALIDGDTAIAKEREPVEMVAYTMGNIYRNQKARIESVDLTAEAV